MADTACYELQHALQVHLVLHHPRVLKPRQKRHQLQHEAEGNRHESPMMQAERHWNNQF